jgi:HupE / UreJ protein
MFDIYLKLGFQHILDLNAYDHILFVMALCAVYSVKDWKKVLVLVTAFTIGHSLTLALSVFNIVRINPSIIELLIPITIIATALFNIFNDERKNKSMKVLYVAALFFGLIHGMGFSNYLNALLSEEESPLLPLLGFNLGVECGQIIVVVISMALSYLFNDILKLSNRYWTVTVSIIAIAVALFIISKQL